VDRFPRGELEKNCKFQGTENVQGQISKSFKMGLLVAVVFIILQIFFASPEIFIIGDQSLRSIFSHTTLLDQSFACKNILWIIMCSSIYPTQKELE